MLTRLTGLSPSGDFYTRALSSAYRHEFRLLDPDFSQDREADIWDIVRLDTKVSQSINQRTASIAAKNWTVQAETDEEPDVRLADLCEQALRKIRNFRESRKQLAMAVFRARSYAFIEGSRQSASFRDFPVMDWWIPNRLKDVDKRRLQLVPAEKGKARAEWQLWNIRKDDFETISESDWQSFIAVTFGDEESRLGYGRGLLESIYFLHWAKQRVMKEGFKAIERWAQGWVVGKVDSNKTGGAGTDSTTARDTMRDELEKHRSKHVLVVDQGDEISIVQGGGEGYQMVRDMVDYCDNCIMAAAMGSVLPFGGQEGVGSLSRAEVEANISDELLEFDRGKIDECLTERLIQQFMNLNRGNLFRLGLARARRPRFITTNPKIEDPKTNAEVIAMVLGAGIPLKKDEVYERLGFSKPAKEDELIEPQQPMALPQPQQGEFSFSK